MTHSRRTVISALIALLTLVGTQWASAGTPQRAAASASPKDLLIEFQAGWCDACRAARPLVERVKAQGYPVRVIDVDQNAALAQRFQVTSIPTFVVIADGRQVDRQVGIPDQDRLEQMLARLKPTRRAPISASSPRATGRVSRSAESPNAARSQDATIQPVSLGAATVEPGVSRVPAAPSSRATNASTASRTAEPIDASVRISVAEPGGRALGSGTIIASRPGEAIVLTCGHLFRDSGGRGRITVDVFADGRPQSYAGELIAYDSEEADVGLVRIAPQGQLPALPVAPRGYDLRQGASIASVGCGGGSPPSVIQGRITAIDRYMGPSNIECTGMPVQGRSGGGLFSPDGYVIGVCMAADPSEGKGLYAGLEAIQDTLDEERLTALYNRPADSSLLADAGAPSDGSVEQVVVPRTDSGDSLADVLASVGEAEVVCVVRPLKDPRARSRVIVLDRASQDFLMQLAREQGVQQSRHLTSLKVGANRGAKLSKHPKLPRPKTHPVLHVRNRPTGK